MTYSASASGPRRRGTDRRLAAPASGSTFALGTTTVTCSATDSQRQHRQRLVRRHCRRHDRARPRACPPTSPPKPNAPSGLVVTYSATRRTTSSTAPSQLPCLPASGSAFPVGVTTVKCSATDTAGNESTGEFTVNITDTTAPVVTAPDDITLEATSAAGADGNLQRDRERHRRRRDHVTCVLAGVGLHVRARHDDGHVLGHRQPRQRGVRHVRGVTVVDTTAPDIAGTPTDFDVDAQSASGAVVTYTSPTGDGPRRRDRRRDVRARVGKHVPARRDDDGHLLGDRQRRQPRVVDLHGHGLRQERADPVAPRRSSSRRRPARTAPPSRSHRPPPTPSTARSRSRAHRRRARPSPSEPRPSTAAPLTHTAMPPTVRSPSPCRTRRHRSLTLPTEPIVAEATGAGGAAVQYTASASDLVDGAVTPVCSAASGSTFAIGTTTVECSATDVHGNTSTGSFDITVQDTTAPTLTLPADITVEATTADGATVNYTASASDLVDGAVTPVCSAASGSTFALGTTTVECSASRRPRQHDQRLVHRHRAGHHRTDAHACRPTSPRRPPAPPARR